jgi:Flp pilus assembly pilin Flp
MPRWRDESGANAVEFALLLPVLIILLFGTMYGASLFNTQQTITQAARDGARFGATLPFSAATGDPAESPEPPPPTAWFDEVAQRALSVIETDRPLTPGDPEVCVRFYKSNTEHWARGDACPDANTDTVGAQGPRVEVNVTRPGRLELGVASTPTITVRGYAVARFEPGIEDN